MSEIVTPPAPASAPASTPPAAASAPAAAPAADWTSGFNDEIKGYVQNKGFKDPASVIDSYRNLEKLMGAPKERLLRLPEKADDPSWGEIYNRLGRPEKPEGYKIQAQDPEFGKWAQGTFHELGLTEKQAEKLLSKYDEFTGGAVKARQEAYQQKIEQESQTLKKEWGAAHDRNVELARRAAKTFGVPNEAIDALEQTMGYAGVMKFMHGLGAKLGEDNFVASGQAPNFGGALSPEAAKQRISQLRGDPAFVQKYVSGDMSAREEMQKLHTWAYPET